ncbi:hypothetical protein [Mesorhizobium sp.]|uniref:hypothetical protein n=1 Tax=Mesorhizobium sp. TaxID=1871066 RepID=UPI0025BB81F9|nr:hypothetical protein [Mesorhizobium sp.]
MAVIGIGTDAIDGDERRALDTELCRELGILDDLEPKRPGFGIGARIGERARPADRVIDRHAVESDEGPDADLGGDEAAA